MRSTGGDGEKGEREIGELRETIEIIGGGTDNVAVGAESIVEKLSNLWSFHRLIRCCGGTLAATEENGRRRRSKKVCVGGECKKYCAGTF